MSRKLLLIVAIALVVAAVEAAQVMPARLVGARGQPGRGSSAGPVLGEDPFDDPRVREFVAQAAAEIDRLSAALSRAEQELAASASAGFLDAGHRVRLESVILQQESEMAQLNAALDRVRALRDLTQWAVSTGTGDETAGTIRITDLSRALNISGSTEAPRRFRHDRAEGCRWDGT